MLLEVCQLLNATYSGTVCHPLMSPQIDVFKYMFICLTNWLINREAIYYISPLCHRFKVTYVTVRIHSNNVNVAVDMLL